MGLYPPWSTLPPELLSAICECLHSNPVDILNFRTVCKTWCSSSISLSKLFAPFPLRIAPPPNRLRSSRSYFASDNATIASATTIYALRPRIADEVPSSMPRAWLAFVDQRNPGKVTIRQPFKQYPFSLPLNFPETLNLMSYHAVELCRFYSISYVSINDVRLPKSTVWFGLVRKVVSFSNCYGGLVIVALSDDGKLGLLRLGSGDIDEGLGEQETWEIIHDGKGFRFDDFVDFKGRMLGIDRRGRLYEIEIEIGSAAVVMNAIAPPIVGGGGRRKRLVESLGCLYLVVRCSVRKEGDAIFKVFVLDEGTGKWVRVNSFGDRTFFMGLEFSFSTSAEELHGLCGKNCVLFSERSFLNYSGYNEDSTLFIGSGDLHVGLWRLEDVAHLGVIGSYPGYANVLWPPPSWIWPTNKSDRLGSLTTTLDMLQAKIPNETLKANFEKLSPHQQEDAITLMMQAHKIKELLEQIRVMDEKMKAIKMLAVSMQQHSTFGNLHNQVEISTLVTEGPGVSVDSMRKAASMSNCDLDWYSMDMKINSCIFEFEEKIQDIEKILKVYKF